MIKLELENGRLTDEQVKTLLAAHPSSDDVTKYVENEAYFKGKNPTIINKKKPDDRTTPDNRVPIPYGRKVALTTKNYMFNRPVNYVADDKKYQESLYEVLYLNGHDKKNTAIGQGLIVHGVAYKLFYTDEISGSVRPLWAVVPPAEIIPVYDYSIEPKLIAAVRYYRRGTTPETNIEIYYPGLKQLCTLKDGIFSAREDVPSGYASIPLVVYAGDYRVGVFDAVKPIIDAIDKIVSQDVNEIEKFELAYLVLTGQKMKPETVQKIKEKRLFELEKDATLEYLTKTINGEFNGSVLDFLVNEVHKQTGVPDFASKDFAAESGIALQYKLMGFENIASDIEAVFKEGEYQSIDLINEIILRNAGKSLTEKMAFWRKQKRASVDIQMSRNLPEDVKQKIDNAKGLKEIGISQETVIEAVSSILPVDEATEMKRKEEEKAAYVDIFKAQPPASKDGDEEGDEKKDDSAA